MKAKELAPLIDAHLKRFEADPKINAERFYTSREGKQESSGHPFWRGGASASGRYVRVRYVSYQGSSTLISADAERYLAWLDAGNVGRHYEALREPAP